MTTTTTTTMCVCLCELYHPRIHGFDKDSDPNINGHYLVITREEEMYDFYKEQIQERRRYAKHNLIRNYLHIVNNIKPEIALILYLSGGECVAILKTCWLRIVQRAWKRVFQERRRMVFRPGFEFQRQQSVQGAKIPGLKGMLNIKM